MPQPRRIHTIPKLDRPREKLMHKGAAALSDFELLEAMIGSGNKQASVDQIARQLVKLFHQGAEAITYESLIKLHGIGPAQAVNVIAALEIARRYLVRDTEPLQSTQDFLRQLADIRAKNQEYFLCLSLDGGRRLIAQRTVTIGTLDTLLTHPREVFADPICDRAAMIVVAHNHPSGDPSPSRQDIILTQQLHDVGRMVGIPLYDHIIVVRGSYYSYKEHRLL